MVGGAKASDIGEKVFSAAKHVFEKSFPSGMPGESKTALRSVCVGTLRALCSRLNETAEKVTELSLSAENAAPQVKSRRKAFCGKKVDTPENRFAKDLLRKTVRLLKKAVKNASGEADEKEISSLVYMTKKLERRIKSGMFSAVTDEEGGTDEGFVPEKTGPYADLYGYYLMLKTAAGVFPLPAEFPPEGFRPEGEDVLIGSLGSEVQLEINLRENFYYTPLSVTDRSKKVRYVALYRSASSADPGIRYYGEITGTDIRCRGDIKVPLRRYNPEEPYVYYGIKEWKTLERPIIPKGEGVAGPRYTCFHLLKSCANTEELFRARPQDGYVFLSALRQLYLDAAQRCAEEKDEKVGGTFPAAIKRLLTRLKKLFVSRA